jgi:predicted amidohydrolase
MLPLTVSLVQGATRWHDAPANRDYYGALVRQARGSDLIVLPETFLSGFSNDIQASADSRGARCCAPARSRTSATWSA